MSRLIKILLSIPKTIWFNLSYLPFSQALKLPIWIATNVRVKEMHRGAILLADNYSLGIIRIGYHEADAVDNFSVHTLLSVESGGRIVIKEDVHIGQGAIINVKRNALLTLGRNFAISGTTTVICNKKIEFGDNVQASWNSLITDSDAHQIFAKNGDLINPNKEILIGNNVWIAANTTILKGTVISDNTVVSSNSLVNKKFTNGNCIIGGAPARVIKNIGSFKI